MAIVIPAPGKAGSAQRHHSAHVWGSNHRPRQVMREAIRWQPPPSKAGSAGRLYYCSQATVRPPTFVMMVNKPNLFSENYRRYIERRLRENLEGFAGTPVRFLWRGKSQRQVDRDERRRKEGGATNRADYFSKSRGT